MQVGICLALQTPEVEIRHLYLSRVITLFLVHLMIPTSERTYYFTPNLFIKVGMITTFSPPLL